MRPLHSIICLLSDDAGPEIVPLDIDGIRAGDMTWGHRFMAPGAVQVSGFEDYRDKLAARHVVLDPAERAERIRHDADSFSQSAVALPPSAPPPSAPPASPPSASSAR